MAGRSFRMIPNKADEEKDREIKAAKQYLSAIKRELLNVYSNNNVVIGR